MKIKNIASVLVCFFLFSFHTPFFAQSIADCIGAQTICQNTFVYPTGLSTTGLIENKWPLPPNWEYNTIGIINKNGNECYNNQGTTNQANWTTVTQNAEAWYYFQAQTPGTICLSIVSPQDYDWIIFDVTNKTCADIKTDQSLIIDCNFLSNNAVNTTGPNGLPNPGGPKENNPCLNVVAGQEFMLYVGQYSTVPSSLTIQVEPTSTASLFDNISPILESAQSPVACGEDTVKVTFSEPLDCSTVTPNKFEVRDAGNNIVALASVVSTNCVNGFSNKDNEFNFVFSPPLNVAGTYTITVNGLLVDLCGNSALGETITFNLTSSNTLTNSSTAEICTGSNGTATVNVGLGTAPYSYEWSTGATFYNINATSNTISGLSSGPYTVTVTDAGGCPAIVNITVPNTVTNLNTTDNTTPSLCASNNGTATVTVTNGTGPFDYLWSTTASTNNSASNSNTITNLSPGTVTVTITDANGCTGTDNNITVTQSNGNISLNAVSNDDALCTNHSGTVTATVSNGVGPYTYTWSFGPVHPSAATTDQIIGLTAGPQSVTVTDANGCSANASATVLQDNGNITLTTASTPSICTNANGTATVTVSNGTGPFDYQWSIPATINGSASNVNTVTSLANNTYSVSITDANGCTANTNVTVAHTTQPAPALSTVYVNNTTCNASNDGSVKVAASSGTSPYTFLWSNTITDDNLTSLSAGNYSVTTTDANGCQANLSVTITSPPPVELSDIKDTSICNFGTATLQANASGGNGGFSYSWSNNINAQSIQVSPTSQTVYSVTATDVNGCVSTNVISVTVNLFPDISLAVPLVTSVCEGHSATLVANATGGNEIFNYQWSTGGNTSSIVLTPTQTQKYYVTVSNGGDCANTPKVDSIVIGVIKNPVVLFTSDKKDGCPNAEITFSIPNYNSKYQYLWSYGEGSQQTSGANSTFNYQNSGCKDVSLRVTSDSGCVSTFTKPCMINIYEKPEIKFSFSPLNPTNLSPNVTFQDRTPGAVSWLWSIDGTDLFTEQEFHHKFEEVGEHPIKLIVENKKGCADTGQAIVKVEYETVIFIPNAFTPNRDYINNEFGPVGEGLKNDGYEFSVLDRWGNTIFSTNKLGDKWNGKYNNTGSVSPEAVYVYHVKYKDFKGQPQTLEGYFTLLNPIMR